jgi:hypothetical protein
MARVKRPLSRDEYAQTVNRMTTHQRNLWARAGYPGQVGRKFEALWVFVAPPKTKKKFTQRAAQ